METKGCILDTIIRELDLLNFKCIRICDYNRIKFTIWETYFTAYMFGVFLGKGGVSKGNQTNMRRRQKALSDLEIQSGQTQLMFLFIVHEDLY